MIQPKISVIIPNWNGIDVLECCLRSLECQTFRSFEVIVVDNGSDDNSVFFLEENFQNIKIIQLSRNFGFSVAVNRGIEAAIGDFIFLLNNDVEVKEDCLERLVDALEKYSHIPVFACKMFYFDVRDIINDAGDFFSAYGFAFQRGNKEKDVGQYDKEDYIFSACAGAALYRRDIFNDVGLFDEDFFAYIEDVDFGFRAQLFGYKSLFIPSAVVYHIDGGTSKRINNFALYFSLRNTLFLITKDFPIILLIIFSPLIILYQIRSFFVFGIRQGYMKLFLKSYFDYFKNLKQLIRKRRIIQRNRRVSSFYIFKVLSKKYPFSLLGTLVRFCRKIMKNFYVK